MNTKCVDCIFFAEEIGCTLDKYHLYESNNIEIIQTKVGPVLQQFICPFKRTSSWLKDRDVDYGTIEDQLIRENGFPFSCFIYEDDELNVLEAVQELMKLEHTPSRFCCIS